MKRPEYKDYESYSDFLKADIIYTVSIQIDQLKKNIKNLENKLEELIEDENERI